MSPRPPGLPEPFQPDEPALAALGALVDRSVVRIAGAARDARTFDRETVQAVSDLWDNAFPLWKGAPPSDRAVRQASGSSIAAAAARSASAPVVSAYRAYPIGEASHRCLACAARPGWTCPPARS